MCYRGPDGHCLGHFCIYMNYFKIKNKKKKTSKRINERKETFCNFISEYCQEY
jgi:hypothetical protein